MRIDVVLLRNIKNLGVMGAVCSVKRGYSTFLLREKMALRATKDNMAYFERERKRLEAQNQALYDEALERQKSLADMFLVFIRSAGEVGQLYGSISVKDIVNALSEKGIHGIKATMVALVDPVKKVGIHTCTIQLYPDVSVAIRLVVAKTVGEADLLEEEARNPKASASSSVEGEQAAPVAGASVEDALDGDTLPDNAEADDLLWDDAEGSSLSDASPGGAGGAEKVDATSSKAGSPDSALSDPVSSDSASSSSKT